MTAWDKYSAAMRKMGDYHALHDTHPDDYEKYSQDPEWQHLNKELNEAMLEYANERKHELNSDKASKCYYKFNDGWFTYYVNVKSHEKKLELEEGDIEVDAPDLDPLDCGLDI